MKIQHLNHNKDSYSSVSFANAAILPTCEAWSGIYLKCLSFRHQTIHELNHNINPMINNKTIITF